METPKVFISHASEDKDRFVIDFATKLRSNGVEAWVDQWEVKILPWKGRYWLPLEGDTMPFT